VSKELAGALIGLGGAVFGALAAGAVSIWSFRQSRRASMADEFRDVLQKLVDLRIKSNDTFRAHADDAATREFLSSALNAKRQLYKATAARILDGASAELAANDYATLGYEYQNDSEFEAALECYLEALARTRTSESRLERVNVLRSLGMLLLLPTALHDRARGERYLREAIELTSGQSDDYSRYTTGYTYDMLAMGLLAGRYPDWKDAADAARQNYEAMSPNNPLRQAALDSLNLRQAQTTAPVLAPKPPPSPADAASLERH
jgi:tetratricopeptide (TPR) repeat protein